LRTTASSFTQIHPQQGWEKRSSLGVIQQTPFQSNAILNSDHDPKRKSHFAQ
jgi:hypothetical protein